MAGSRGSVRALHRPASGPVEYYQRPHVYGISVGTARMCIAPLKQRSPAITLLVQADLANLGIIRIGDSGVAQTVGIQLDSGKAAMFCPTTNPMNQPGSIGTGLSSYMDVVEYPTEAAVAQSLGGLSIENPIRLLIDISDFYAIADRMDQRLQVFWVESVRFPASRG